MVVLSPKHVATTLFNFITLSLFLSLNLQPVLLKVASLDFFLLYWKLH